MSDIDEKLKKYAGKFAERKFFIIDDVYDETFVNVCPICGEPFKANSSFSKCCPKCVKAVMKMRSMMTEEELNG